MATINFYLNKPDRKGLSPIMMVYQNKGQKFKYFTKQKVKKIAWNKGTVKSNYSGASEINSILKNFEEIINSIEREALFSKKTYPIETIKQKFRIQLGHLDNSNDFFRLFEMFIQKNIPTKAETTIKNYQSTRNRLIEFEKEIKTRISFENINNTFYDGLVNYLIEKKSMLNNSVGKHIKILKVFLNYAVENGFSNPINLKKFKVFNEENQMIYLTEPELLKLYYLDGLNERLTFVRDNFCFACFTGLRFSDIQKLTINSIKDNFIEVRAKKTKGFLKIPLNDYAKEILIRNKDKFNNSILPPGISNQKTNTYLKELGVKAEINEKLEIEKFTGSLKLVETKTKFELLTTHTARRTFVTLALEKGMRPEIVMEMTGHSNYNTFKKYIKITEKVKEIEMNRLWKKERLRIVK